MLKICIINDFELPIPTMKLNGIHPTIVIRNGKTVSYDYDTTFLVQVF